MTNEFCPRCNALRKMVATSSINIITNSHGEKEIIKTCQFHCSTCNLFVRSEELGEMEKELGSLARQEIERAQQTQRTQ